jgi:N-acetylglutamate synthase-like GNAT family acetyltransferase
MSVVIQPFNQSYTADVQNLILNIQQAEFNLPISLPDQPDLEDISKFYQQGKGNFWVAVEDEKVAGTIGLLHTGEDYGVLRKLFVSEKYRGGDKKVAKKLLDTLLDFAVIGDLKEIYLGTTDRFKAAHRFYEKNNFSRISENELPENFPRMKVDSVFYKIKF